MGCEGRGEGTVHPEKGEVTRRRDGREREGLEGGGSRMDGKERGFLKMCESQCWPLATAASSSRADLAL